MSSDYRPRGGGSSSSSSGGGGRRRRGGRGRSHPGASHGEHRSHTNGHSTPAPKKKEGPLSKLIGWLTGKSKKKSEHTVKPSGTTRHEYTKERTPRAERTERAERSERGERTEPAPRADRPQRAEPTPQEIVSPKLYVGNLAYEAAESDLFDHFSKVGHVKNVEVAMDRRSGRSKGFGFVEMESVETAKAAAEKLNRTDFMGRQIVVSGAKVEKRPAQAPREEERTEESTHSEAETHEHHPETHEHQPESGSSSPDTTV